MDTLILSQAANFIIGLFVALFACFAFFYIFISASNAKILRMLEYKHAWIGWIPYLSYFALADATAEEGNDTKIFDKFDIPNTAYKLWWVLLLIVVAFDSQFAWIPTAFGFIVDTVFRIFFLGGAYAKAYSKIEKRSEKEKIGIALWSGAFPIVAAVKIMFYKKEQKQ